MDAPQDILLIRLKSIGDILFTIPAVHVVRAAYPAARIAFLVSKESAPLLEGFDEVNTVITLDRERFRGFRPRAILGEAFGLLRRLRASRFALAIDFQGYGETALFTWCTGAPERWGVVYRRGRQWAYTRGIARDNAAQPADGHLSFLRRCGLPAFPVRNEFQMPAGPLVQAREFFTENGLDPARPTLFIQPYTSSAQKDWPLDRYQAVARHWRGRGIQVIFGGGPAERAALAPVRAAGFPVSAGVPLLVTGALMTLSTVVLGGDTGLLHLAVAGGKRVVMIMGSVGPGSCYPFGHKEWAVVPLDGALIAGIAEERIHAALAPSLS